METCKRCHTKTDTTIMSTFNTQVICMECKKKEEEHPKYPEARAAEEAAVKRGDYNYLGIGLPAGL